MKPDEIRKLLGGFATGTLTERERELLFSAALENQALFDALANEEALREMLADPATRAELLEELQARPVVQFAAAVAPAAAPREPENSLWTRLWKGMTPWRFALAGALAAVVLAISVVQYARLREPATFTEVALNRVPERSAPEIAAQRKPQASPARKDAPSIAPRQLGQLADERRATPMPEKRARDAVAPREESSRIATNPLAASSVVQPAAPSAGAVAPAAPPPSTPGLAASAVVEEQALNKAAAAPRVAAQTLVGRNGAVPSPPPAALAARIGGFSARVTDVNGTIVSISAGSGAGVKVGETLEIVRDNRVLGVIRISEAREAFSVGAFEPAPGNRLGTQPAGGRVDTAEVGAAVQAGRPRAGDAVRRPSAPPDR